MKKIISLSVLALGLLALSGCIKDTVTQSFVYYRPVYKTKAEVRSNVKSSSPIPIQHAGKLFYKDGYVFLNELDKGVHIIDVRNPAAPEVKAFIAIPGCIDLAVRGNILYADLSTDLVAIDISQPLQSKLTAVLESVFPHRYYSYFAADTNRVIVDWVRVDTTITDESAITWGMTKAEFDGAFQNVRATTSSGGGGSVSNGTGGSMARFALLADRLYAVSHSDIKIINTAVPDKPVFVKGVNLPAWDIETIFPFGQFLFMGSSTGVHIYSVSVSKDNPVFMSKFEHARVCDPVVTDGEYAYVTLRNGTECGGFINQMDILNVKQVDKPAMIKSYPMTNPHGLSVDGDVVLVCDGPDGLRLMDVANPAAARQLGHLKGFTAYDVIAVQGIAMVSATNGLILVDYSNPQAPVVRSTVAYMP